MKAYIHPDHRSIRTVFNGAAAWEKYPAVHKRPFSSAFFNLCAALTRRPVLRSTHNPDAVDALTFEKARLRYMRERGYLVPEILDESEDSVVLSHVGTCLTHVLKNAKSMDERAAVIEQAVTHLAYVHSSGDYHGRSVAKDMTVLGDKIGMIDFEHNPLAVMSLPEAQARDFWLLVLTTRKYLSTDAEAASRLTSIYRNAAPRDAVECLKDNVTFLDKASLKIDKLQERLGFRGSSTVLMNREIARTLSR